MRIIIKLIVFPIKFTLLAFFWLFGNRSTALAIAALLLIASFNTPHVDPNAFYGIFGSLAVLHFISRGVLKLWKRRPRPALKEPPIRLPPTPKPSPAPVAPAKLPVATQRKPEPALPPAHQMPPFQPVRQVGPPMSLKASPSIEQAYARLPETIKRMLVPAS